MLSKIVSTQRVSTVTIPLPHTETIAQLFFALEYTRSLCPFETPLHADGTALHADYASLEKNQIEWVADQLSAGAHRQTLRDWITYVVMDWPKRSAQDQAYAHLLIDYLYNRLDVSQFPILLERNPFGLLDSRIRHAIGQKILSHLDSTENNPKHNALLMRILPVLRDIRTAEDAGPRPIITVELLHHAMRRGLPIDHSHIDALLLGRNLDHDTLTTVIPFFRYSLGLDPARSRGLDDVTPDLVAYHWGNNVVQVGQIQFDRYVGNHFLTLPQKIALTKAFEPKTIVHLSEDDTSRLTVDLINHLPTTVNIAPTVDLSQSIYLDETNADKWQRWMTGVYNTITGTTPDIALFKAILTRGNPINYLNFSRRDLSGLTLTDVNAMPNFAPLDSLILSGTHIEAPVAVALIAKYRPKNIDISHIDLRSLSAADIRQHFPPNAQSILARNTGLTGEIAVELISVTAPFHRLDISENPLTGLTVAAIQELPQHTTTFVSVHDTDLSPNIADALVKRIWNRQISRFNFFHPFT